MYYTAKPIEVEAFRIIEVIVHGAVGLGYACEIELESGYRMNCSPAMTARHFPALGDYLVRVPQTDGTMYDYLNPKDVFESKYVPVTDPGDGAQSREGDEKKEGESAAS